MLVMLTILVVGLYVVFEALDWVRSGILLDAARAFIGLSPLQLTPHSSGFRLELHHIRRGIERFWVLPDLEQACRFFLPLFFQPALLHELLRARIPVITSSTINRKRHHCKRLG
jgi:ABC-type protease/lipase transport system fused ATPase/permease subunit